VVNFGGRRYKKLSSLLKFVVALYLAKFEKCANVGLQLIHITAVTRRATLGDHAFPVVAARAWNALPDYVTSAPTYSSFRTALKTYLFCRTFWHWQHASHWLCNVVLKGCYACTTFILSYDDDDDDITVIQFKSSAKSITIVNIMKDVKFFLFICVCRLITA